jgi:hypothetical protein
VVKSRFIPNPDISLTFACAIECKRNWINAASLLRYSLQRNGGAFRNSPFVLYVAVPGDTPRERLQLGDLSVRFMPRLPHMPYLHKANILHEIDSLQTSHVLLLDHDLIVRQLTGLTDFLDRSVCARRNNKDSLVQLISEDYARRLPDLAQRAWEEVPYFNSGVVLVPADRRLELHQRWCDIADQLFALYQNPLAEQVALGVAIARLDLAWQYLPTRFNQTNWGELLPDASIIHYNDFDKDNRHVKARCMEDFGSLRRYLATTKNQFWAHYRQDIIRLITPELESLAESICSFCLAVA